MSLDGQPAASALVTGAGAGIGLAVARRLTARGFRVTCVDVDLAAAQRAVQACGGGERALAVEADVSSSAALSAAFERHVARWGAGTLRACVNNAGVGDGAGAEAVVGVNLLSHFAAAALCERHMADGGAIVNVASAGGLWPMPHQPMYAATKSGVLMFTRSAAPSLYRSKRIRMTALCPTYTADTGMGDAVRGMGSSGKVLIKEATRGKGMAKLEEVVGAVEALIDGGEPGQALAVVPGQLITWQWSQRQRGAGISPKSGRRSVKAEPGRLLAPLPPLPATRRLMRVKQLSTDFEAATEIVEEPMPRVAGSKVLVARCFAGVNASDVNFSAGRYFGRKAAAMLPFGAGMEAVGYVAAAGPEALAKGVRVGMPVSTLEYGAFSTHGVVDARQLLPCRSVSAESLALLTSGLTASLALERAAGLRRVGERGQPRRRVLVTAAAGGTGQFAVQLARLWGHEVVATCGSPQKASLLRMLGAHRVINYREEDVGAVLRNEFKAGFDVIFESVGGEMFDTVSRHVAVGGTIVVIGMMSAYKDAGGDAGGWPMSSHAGLTERLLWRGAAAKGFFLLQHAPHYRRHLAALQDAHARGELRCAVDPAEFEGLGAVADAVAHLQAGRSAGKVAVRLAAPPPVAQQAKL